MTLPSQRTESFANTKASIAPLCVRTHVMPVQDISMKIAEHLALEDTEYGQGAVWWLPCVTASCFMAKHFNDSNASAHGTDNVARNAFVFISPGDSLSMGSPAYAAASARRIRAMHSDCGMVIVAGLAPSYADRYAGTSVAVYGETPGSHLLAKLDAVAASSAGYSTSPFESALDDTRITALDLFPSRFFLPSSDSADIENPDPIFDESLSDGSREASTVLGCRHRSSSESSEDAQPSKRIYLNTNNGPWRIGGGARSAYWNPIEQPTIQSLPSSFRTWLYIPANPDCLLAEAVGSLELPPCRITTMVFKLRLDAHLSLLACEPAPSRASIDYYMKKNRPRQRECFVADHIIIMLVLLHALRANLERVWVMKEAVITRLLYEWASRQKDDSLLCNLQILNSWPSSSQSFIPTAEELEEMAAEALQEAADRMRELASVRELIDMEEEENSEKSTDNVHLAQTFNERIASAVASWMH